MLKCVANVIALAPIRLTFHALKPGKKSINALDKISARIGIGIGGWGHDKKMGAVIKNPNVSLGHLDVMTPVLEAGGPSPSCQDRGLLGQAEPSLRHGGTDHGR